MSLPDSEPSLTYAGFCPQAVGYNRPAHLMWLWTVDPWPPAMIDARIQGRSGAEDAEQRGSIAINGYSCYPTDQQPTCLQVTFASNEGTSRKTILTHSLAFLHLGLQLSDNFVLIFTTWKVLARRIHQIPLFDYCLWDNIWESGLDNHFLPKKISCGLEKL